MTLIVCSIINLLTSILGLITFIYRLIKWKNNKRFYVLMSSIFAVIAVVSILILSNHI
jgi:hypothetical protein